MSYLLCIEKANPDYLHTQEEFTAFYGRMIGENSDDERKIKIISKKSGVRQRYSVLPDFSGGPKKQGFFNRKKEQVNLPGLSERMAIYQREAITLSLKAVARIEGFSSVKNKITHIISVTCTGLFAPGLDIELIRALELKPATNRSSINFMGCNAAVLALKQADQICRAENDALVLIVCTELCTLHFQDRSSPDHILSNLLFADGAAAVLVSSKKVKLGNNYRPLKINSFQSLIIHEGHTDMAWRVSEEGFIMNLSSYVSGLLNGNIGQLLRKSGIQKEDIRHWAVHPGGKKILDDFSQLMELSKAQLKHSYSVLENYGNMSSPTILFVLDELLRNEAPRKNDTIYAAAFGPGLSIESLLLQHV